MVTSPYQFKLRFLHRFTASPLRSTKRWATGGLHDALAEVHKRALAGDLATRDAAEERAGGPPLAHPVRLHVQARGNRELTGENADLIEVLNLDPDERSKREVVYESLLEGVQDRIREAGVSLRGKPVTEARDWCGACQRCDQVALWRSRGATTVATRSSLRATSDYAHGGREGASLPRCIAQSSA